MNKKDQQLLKICYDNLYNCTANSCYLIFDKKDFKAVDLNNHLIDQLSYMAAIARTICKHEPTNYEQLILDEFINGHEPNYFNLKASSVFPWTRKRS